MIHRSFSFADLFTVLCFLLLFSSCRTVGLYSSNPKSKIAFAGTEFHLTKSDSFFLRSWTDSYSRYVDEDGNRIFKEEYQYRGYGTYDCDGDSLELTFCNGDSITIKLDLDKRKEETEITFQIFDELGNITFPNVQIIGDANQIIRRTLVQIEDTYNFVLPNLEHPQRIKIKGFGMSIENPIIDFSTLGSGSYTFKRKTYDGYFTNGEVKKIWFRKRPTGIRFQLNERKRYLPRKWGWGWINKFYRDY